MAEFSTRGDFGAASLDAWIAITEDPNSSRRSSSTLAIAALTAIGMLVLLVPTMTWTYLRVPALKRPVEFLCLLPLAIPAIVLVVGIVPIYSILRRTATRASADARVHRHHPRPAVRPSGDRRGLRSIDVATLAEAARSLGAGWPRVDRSRSSRRTCAARSCLRRSSRVALVLGEFTISSLLNYDTLQVVINLLGKRDAFVAVAVSLAALVFAFVLIFGIASSAASGDGRPKNRSTEEPSVMTVTTAARHRSRAGVAVQLLDLHRHYGRSTPWMA